MLVYLLLFIAAAALSFLMAFPVRSLALYFDVVDRPEKRKMHQIPIPLLGGLAIGLAFTAVSAAVLTLRPDLAERAWGPYTGLMAGIAIILLLGVYDDIRGASPLLKFGVQTIAALVAVSFGEKIDLFTNPLGASFEIGWLGIPIAVLWIVGVTNAVNLIDGLDGLAAGVGGIAALGLFAVAYPTKSFVAAMMITLAGSVAGFLRHNFYPARLFLGDTGSMFIGFTLAVVGMHGSLKSTAATVLFLPIIVLGVPIFDTLFAILRRARRRVSPFKPDREHIHHRLVRVGLHHRTVVLVLYFVCAYLALTAYSISMFPYRTAFLFLVLLTMGGMIGLRTLSFIEERLERQLEAQGAVGQRGEALSSSGVRPAAARITPPDLQRAGRFSVLVCEVAGFREDFGSPGEIELLQTDIQSLLSRRVEVRGVVVEPSGPGRLILLIRSSHLSSAMAALIRDGLAWYLGEGRERFAGKLPFPVIDWIRPDGSPTPLAGEPAREVRESRTSGPRAVKDGRTGVA